MKVKASVKNLRRRPDCQIVKRKKRTGGKIIYIICKGNRRFKAKQG